MAQGELSKIRVGWVYKIIASHKAMEDIGATVSKSLLIFDQVHLDMMGRKGREGYQIPKL